MKAQYKEFGLCKIEPQLENGRLRESTFSGSVHIAVRIEDTDTGKVEYSWFPKMLWNEEPMGDYKS